MIAIIDEDFVSDYTRDKHYDTHVTHGNRWERQTFRGLSKDEYVKRAEDLANARIDNKKIFGYVSQDAHGHKANVKWNKDTEEFVAYSYDLRDKNGRPLIKSFYTKSFRDFNADKSAQYLDEIEE